MASRSLGTLTLDLIADIGGYTKGLDKAERESAKRTKAINKVFSRMGAAIGVAVTAAVASLAYMVKQTINTADQIAKTSQAIGVNAQEFQALSFAADLSGVSNERLADSLKKLSKNMDDANSGLLQQKQAFEDIGVAVTDAEGNLRDSIDVLKDISDVFSTAQDGAGKTAIAMKLFGKSGADIIPLLNSGREAIEELEAQARKLGLVMSDETLKGAEKFNDSLTSLRAVQKGLAAQITAEMLPTLNEFTGFMIEVSTETDFAAKTSDILSASWKTLATAAIITYTTIETLGTKTKSFAKSIAQAASGNIGGAVATVVIEMDNVTVALERLNKLWSGAYADAGGEASRITRDLGDALGSLSEDGLDAQTTMEANAKTIADFIAALEFQVDTIGLSTDAIERERLALIGADAATLERIQLLQEMVADIESSADGQERFNELLEKHRALLTGVTDEQFAYNEKLKEIVELYQQGAISLDEYTAALARAADEQAGLKQKTEQTIDIIGELGLDAAKAAQGALADFLFDPFDDGLEGMVKGFAATMQRIVAEAAAAAIFEKLFSQTGGGAGGFFASLFGGGKEHGGPVVSGSVYEVGERNRPELFISGGRQFMIPGNNGRVEPIRSSGHGNVTQVFNIVANDPNQFRRSERQIKRATRKGLAA